MDPGWQIQASLSIGVMKSGMQPSYLLRTPERLPPMPSPSGNLPTHAAPTPKPALAPRPPWQLPTRSCPPALALPFKALIPVPCHDSQDNCTSDLHFLPAPESLAPILEPLNRSHLLGYCSRLQGQVDPVQGQTNKAMDAWLEARHHGLTRIPQNQYSNAVETQ